MVLKTSRSILKRRCAIVFLTILAILWTPAQSLAVNKISVVMLTQESMQEHNSDEPRRLMCDILLQEFARGSVIQVVNQENSRTLSKSYHADYHVGANLIAFSFAPKTPINVSISVQLLDKKTGNVFLTSDRAMFIDENIVEAGLKLHKSEFDNSAYGKALTALSKASAIQFQEKVQHLSLPPQL